jgi:hypothetical protein
MKKLQPSVTRFVDGKIIEAKCEMCDAHLQLGKEVGSADQQAEKLQEKFKKHLITKHGRQDFNQAAARIVRRSY